MAFKKTTTQPKRIVVTSALPYANGPIHIGHLVEYIQTDIYVRFLKLCGIDAAYCCADDTHGTPIEINAAKQGISPERLIAKYHAEHQQDFKGFLIEFDSYYSTNSPENQTYADLIFTALKDAGHIYQKKVENFYDEKEGRFLPDRYVKGECPKCGAPDQYGDVCEKCNATYSPTDLVNPYSIVSGERPVRKASVHYFFRLSSFSERLSAWLTGNTELQKEVVNHVMRWVEEGLQDWDISRDGPYFGFRIPGEKDKYYYVWLDAPIGYISSTENYVRERNSREPDPKRHLSTADYWKSDSSRIIHFIGKDIIYFHLLFWPAMLMASGFRLPDKVVVHGFLTINREKMSKSRGTFITARDYLSRLDPLYLRYYYAANLTSKPGDLDLDFEDFKAKTNNELVGNIANFTYRTLSFLKTRLGGRTGGLRLRDYETEAGEVVEILGRIRKDYEGLEFREAVKGINELASIGNRFFQEREPWKLAADEPEEARAVLTFCANVVKELAITLKPVLPTFSAGLEAQLGLKGLSWKDLGFTINETIIKGAEILVGKLEEVDLRIPADEDPSGKGKGAAAGPAGAALPLDLRVAKVVAVEDHPDADKLIIMRIDLGGEERQIVAGIRQWYRKEDLVGRNLVVVANLEPAKLRGVESQAMLLACDGGKDIEVIFADASSPGDRVGFEGAAVSSATVSFPQFQGFDLQARKGAVLFAGKPLRTSSEPIVTRRIPDGKVR
ncbi:methionine--tRNA ligase [Candidatus Woesearchaeota archaeon]|nr:methionine--tRNA ligase [Candidatus Woesearchaeota archaeon]